MSRFVRFLLPAAVAASAIAWFPFTDSAQEPSRGQEPARQQEPHGEHAEDEGPLHDAMETLDRGMKGMRRTITDPEKTAENMERLHGMQAAALTAVSLCPEPFNPLSDTEKIVWRIGYERKMLTVIDGLLQIELALVEGRHDEAREIYSQLTGLKKEGHDTYTPPEEE